MPLVRGGYPSTFALRKLTGNAANLVQASLTPRSNQEWLKYSSADAAAALVSGVATSVAVPVEVGDVISKVTVLVGLDGCRHPQKRVRGGLQRRRLTRCPDAARAVDQLWCGGDHSLDRVDLFAAVAAVNHCPERAAGLRLCLADGGRDCGAEPRVGDGSGGRGLPGHSVVAGVHRCCAHGAALTTTAPATITGQTAASAVPVVFLT